MNSKRGQVTLFIILAVVIIALALVLYFFVFKEKSTPQTDLGGIKVQITDILEKQVLANIETILIQGGYAVPQDSLTTGQYHIAYWVKGNQTAIPEIKEISNNLDILNNKIEITYLPLLFTNTNITAGTITSNTTTLSDSIRVTINWPITIKQGTTTQRIENFNFEYKIRAGKLYDAAKYAAASAAMGEIPLEMPQDTNLTVYFQNNSTLYEITDINPYYSINNKQSKLVFATK